MYGQVINLQWRLLAVLKFCCSDYIVSFDWHFIWFFGLIFQGKHTELPYDKSVTVTETVSTELSLGREVFKKNCHGEIRENSSED